MSSSCWKRYKLSDISGKITKGTTPTTLGHPFVSSGINFIKAESILMDGSIDKSRFVFIDDFTHNKLKRSQLAEGDILFSMAGMVLGKSAVVKKEHLPANTNQALGIIRLKFDKANPYFVSYYMKQKAFFSYVNTSTGQSAQPNINLEEIGALEINIPDISTQRRIVAILSALDDKIELNRQTNETLEAIAQAIYKEWFVNFNFPGATGEMQDSEFGPIPKGWRIISLGDITDLTWGDTNTTKKSYVPVGYPAFSASGQDGFLPHHDFNRDGIVISAIGAYAGKTWFAIGKWSCIKNTIRFWSIHPEISNEYLYMATSRPGFWPLRGSAQPFISQTDARGLKVFFPSGDIAKKFGEVTNSIFRQIAENDIQNNYLGQVREGLLPRLMTGEIEL